MRVLMRQIRFMPFAIVLFVNSFALDITEADQSKQTETSNQTNQQISTPTDVGLHTEIFRPDAEDVAPAEKQIDYYDDYEDASDENTLSEQHLLSKLSDDDYNLNSLEQNMVLAFVNSSQIDLDGRSAYINNKFVPDDEINLTDSAPPLYEFLQQQIEQVLSANSHKYPPHTKKPETSTAKNKDEQFDQPPPSKPLFASYGTQDLDESSITEPLTNKLVTNKTQKTDQNQKISHNKTLSTNVKIKSTTAKPLRITAPTRNTRITTHRPTIGMRPITQNPIIFTGTTLKRKRRITFQTVSSGSQLVSTPLADLMLKYSIAIAKPTNSFHMNTNFDNPNGFEYEDSEFINSLPTKNKYNIEHSHVRRRHPSASQMVNKIIRNKNGKLQFFHNVLSK